MNKFRSVENPFCHISIISFFNVNFELPLQNCRAVAILGVFPLMALSSRHLTSSQRVEVLWLL